MKGSRAHLRRPGAGLLALAAAAATVLIVPGVGATSAPPRESPPWAFQFLYTTASAKRTDLWRGRYLLVGGRLVMRAAQPVGHVAGADGVLRLSDGRLLVHASGERLLLLDARTARVIRAWHVPGARQAVLDPSGRLAWILGRPGRITALRLGPGGRARTHALSGPDRNLAAVAFDRGGQSYYVTPDGDLGILDLRRFTTHRLGTPMITARSMVVDPFSGDLMLVGGGRLVALDPRTLTVVNTVTLESAVATAAADHASRPAACGPVGTDRRGTLLVACGRALAFVRLAPGGASQDPVSVHWITAAATGLAPTILARVDSGPYVKKKKCRPHHCGITQPPFTG